jgi:beta-lactamase regulating signal transducer with metallopeptidase domain
MTLSAALLRALAHGLLDVSALSAVLALAAFAIGRIGGIAPGARSRWWSAVAVVPLFALACALVLPLVNRAPAHPAAAYAGNALLVDPLDSLLRAGSAAPAPPSSTAPAPPSASVAAPVRRPIPWLELVLALWFAVAAYRVGGVLRSLVNAHRLATTSPDAPPGTLAADAAARRIALRMRHDVATPFAIGLTQRSVILPAQLAAALPAAELRAVVLHEMAHLRRRDDWMYLFERLACAVLWFNPFISTACRASGSWREIACDAAAARETGSRTCATALWRSASTICGAGASQPALALLSGGILVDRVEALLHPVAASARRTLAATLGLALAAGAMSAVVIVRAPAYASPAFALSGLAPTGSMHTRRASFVLVKLHDGRVLVAGGMLANHNFTAAAELYDPARGTFEPTGSMHEGRVGLDGTLLPDGRVLITGGWTTTHGVTASAEIYDPTSGRFTTIAPMRSPRAGHTTTLLRDGTVLIAGGAFDNNAPTATAELYDPRQGTFDAVGSMPDPRASHTATLLGDGRVLVTGGTELRSTALYDPAARRFTPGPPMLSPRSKHGATLLSDGSVLVIGGGSDNGWNSRLTSTERYLPAENRFVAAGTLNSKRFKLRDAAVRLRNGDVLVAGGSEQVELYDAAHDRFRTVGAPMENARNLSSAVLLDDGSVLIAGGYASVDPLPTTETALRYR